MRSKALTEYPILLETTIDRLLPSSRPVLLLPLLPIHVVYRDAYLGRLSPVAAVSLYHLTVFKLADQAIPEDGDIWEDTTGKGTANMNDIAPINREGNLVSNARAFELVRVPTGGERSRLIDSEIRAVHCRHTPSVPVTSIILPV
jgi:hypothetical protein